MKRLFYICAAISYLLVLSCTGQNTELNKKITVKRFDKVLQESMEKDTADSARRLLCDEYTAFLEIYATKIIKCCSEGDSATEIISGLKSVYNNTEGFRQLYEYTGNRYPDMDDVEKELSSGFSRYAEMFPENKIPEIYTHVSGFSYSIVTADSLLSISLDNYLGKDYPGYKGVFFDYQLKDRERSRIVPDVLEVCLYNEYPYRRETRRIIDGMIYEGCIAYVTGVLLPDRDMADIMNYSAVQTEWCRKNEDKAWKYIVKSDHLYSSDPLIYAKYLNEAPYTSFFDRNSPDRIGKWIGYKIIDKYMKSAKRKSTIKDILRGSYDTSEILATSGYGNK